MRGNLKLQKKPSHQEIIGSLPEELQLSGEIVIPDERELLLQLMADQLAGIMDRDGHKLFTTLYRLDIPEAQVKKAFEEHPLPELPYQLAVLIYERQVARLQSWQAYMEKNKNDKRQNKLTA